MMINRSRVTEKNSNQLPEVMLKRQGGRPQKDPANAKKKIEHFCLNNTLEINDLVSLIWD